MGLLAMALGTCAWSGKLSNSLILGRALSLSCRQQLIPCFQIRSAQRAESFNCSAP